MAKYTEYYNLKKPEQNENYSVEDANTNNTIIDSILNGKVDKIAGKDLSSNDFTDRYKAKLDTIQEIYKYKGSVSTYSTLINIEKKEVGDVYNVIENSTNYSWNGESWTELGVAINIDDLVKTTDLKEYVKEEELSEVRVSINDIVEHKYSLKITSAITAGTEMTIPCYFKVGQAVLDVYLNGERLLLSSDVSGTDGHYVEVGAVNSISKKIKTTTDWSLVAGDVLDFIVRGDYSAT